MRRRADAVTAVSFIDVQRRFTRHIRDPDNAPAPADVEARRMAVYRDLLFRNVAGFLESSFPVLRKIHKDEEWRALVREYFKNHRARTPLFPRMPAEFLQFLQDGAAAARYPFLWELAHYEWVEPALFTDKRECRRRGIDESGDLLTGAPVLNNLAWSLAYRYPVHRISPEYLPLEPPPQPTCLLVYRDRRDEVRFIELNPATARLADSVRNNPGGKTGGELLEDLARELGRPGCRATIDGGRAMLEELREKQAILGVEKTVSS